MAFKPRSTLTEADKARLQRLAKLAMSRGDLQDRSFAAEHEGLVKEATAKCDDRFPMLVRDATLSDPGVCRWVDAFKGAPINESKSIMISGPVGSGKTWQAYAALRAVVTFPRTNPRTGFEYLLKWRALTFSDFAASIRPQHGADLRAEFDALKRVPLLMLDDFGSGKITEAVEDATFMLIDYRLMHQLPMIMTTNLQRGDFVERIGDRTTSRLGQLCDRVVMKGHDRRAVGVR